jgi:hypothetical protein
LRLPGEQRTIPVEALNLRFLSVGTHEVKSSVPTGG